MVFLPHACLRQVARVDGQACLTLQAITPEMDANSSRKQRFPPAHKLAKIGRSPPHAVMPMLGLQAVARQRKLQNLRL
ncbi:hypothetical protein EAS54_18525 [Bradyrhizobium guangzhouense]|uniref:Uncharacterized protein n=1 Tax=Bradyrhizobium guangzhouense TaxID=1325095 RepID=A0AAE5X5S3_9BRAD|nr:hypothetical protein XH91_30375 [Bradyrhizobium guangzhouense]RXH15734.1 hypothetical protein EAS54_18525 [Bradyrhizobium guangzhouense]RXH15940.1 hypothetical protein EAS56_07945 [Bradyrhizobium guangzhouense]